MQPANWLRSTPATGAGGSSSIHSGGNRQGQGKRRATETQGGRQQANGGGRQDDG
jgi:hypothetical protein